MHIGKILINCLIFMAVAAPIASCATTILPQSQASTDENIGYPNRRCDNELPARPDGITLDVPHLTQKVDYVPEWKSNLCWATCISMVSTYLGTPRVPCQVVSLRSKGIDCCQLTSQSPSNLIAQCNHGDDLSPPLHEMGIYNIYDKRRLSEEELHRQLSNGRPVIPHIELEREQDGKKVTLYHVMVIAGYKEDRYLVLNPNPNSSDDLNYAQLMGGDDEHWRWIATWYHFSYRKDGCNANFNPSCDCVSH